MTSKTIFVEPPGATPIEDSSGLIPRNVKTREQLFVAEAKNISKAVTKYLAATPSKRRAPFTLDWVYKLHGEMFGKVWKWAGQKRTWNLNIGVPFYQIDHDLKNLLDDLEAWHMHGSYGLVEQAVRLHHRAVQIHPFNNGNGRWGRLLSNVWLKRCGSAPVRWPEETIKNSSPIRERYIEAMKAADRQSYEALTALHLEYLRRD